MPAGRLPVTGGPQPATSQSLTCGWRGEARPAIPPHRGWRTTRHSDLPDTLKLKELSAEQRRLANFVDFIGEGRGSQALGKALVETERRVESLTDEVDALRRSDEKVFQPQVGGFPRLGTACEGWGWTRVRSGAYQVLSVIVPPGPVLTRIPACAAVTAQTRVTRTSVTGWWLARRLGLREADRDLLGGEVCGGGQEVEIDLPHSHQEGLGGNAVERCGVRLDSQFAGCTSDGFRACSSHNLDLLRNRLRTRQRALVGEKLAG